MGGVRQFAMAVLLALAAWVAPMHAHAQFFGQRDLPPQAQLLMAPLIGGIAYDQSQDRVFASICPRRMFACDLAEIDLSAGAGELIYVRRSQDYGYAWPAVSADGRYLAAVRTLRRQRPSDRNVQQEIVRIDLRSGEEAVIAPAGAWRYERLHYLGDEVLALRSSRSSENVRCRGDFCTDVARFIVASTDGVRVSPQDFAADGGVGSGFTSFVPLGRHVLWGFTREPGLPGRVASRVDTVAIDVATLETVERARNVYEKPEMFARVAARYGDLGGWRLEQLTENTGHGLEFAPFGEMTATFGGHEQTSILSSQRAIALAKTPVRGGTTLTIDVLEYRGQPAWERTRSVTVLYRR